MNQEELEDALLFDIVLRIYTDRIGRYVEGLVVALHWPAAPDAFLLEGTEHTSPNDTTFYSIERGDPSLIVEFASQA